MISLKDLCGRYLGEGHGFRLDLRVDIANELSSSRVSGDLFETVGTGEYDKSFIITNPIVSTEREGISISGVGKLARGLGANRELVEPEPIRLDVRIGAGMAKAKLTFTGVRGGLTIFCERTSEFFRTFEYEIAYLGTDWTTQLYDEYHTGALNPAPSVERRLLTIERVWAEAGLKAVEKRKHCVALDTPPCNGNIDYRWTIKDLNQAMKNESILCKEDVPGWKIWLFLVGMNYKGNNSDGFMFDTGDDVQRKGCHAAQRRIFRNAGMIPWPEDRNAFPPDARGQLEQAKAMLFRGYIHEMAHCLNLDHAHEKRTDKPTPFVQRWDSLSFMCEPHHYTGLLGDPVQYWNRFNFKFDDLELAHLRHAMLPDIMPGRNPWTLGADSIW